VPIPGTKRHEYLEDNAGAADIELTRDYLARIEEVAPVGAAGERYDEACRPLIGNTTGQGHR
jgi:hypothetical protein